MSNNSGARRSAVVTGTSQGLGLAFVQELLKRGYFVFATSTNRAQPPLRHADVEWNRLNLRSDSEIRKFGDHIRSVGATISLVINNAGVNKRSISQGEANSVNKIGSLTRPSMLEMFDVNCVAPLLLVRELLDSIDHSNGAIINVSSSRGSFHDEFDNKGGNYGYRASKAALNLATLSLVKDLPESVRVFSVHPGSVNSAMNPRGTDRPDLQAGRILDILDKWDQTMNGAFLRYSGEVYEDYVGPK